MPETIQAFITLISEPIQAFSSSEILGMIDPGDLDRIKAADPHPFFKAWVLAHEGESRPRFAGEANPIRVSWPKRAIQATVNAIKKGIKFFFRHNQDNSTNGRPELGEIVASKLMDIGGKLSHVVIGYFPPETRDRAKSLDVCSMEAIWDMAKDGAGYIANGIRELTGVALGNGNFDKPAFAGAGELASVQAFEKEGEGDDPGNKQGEHEMEITFKGVESYLKTNRVYPHQVYTWQDILDDKSFSVDVKEIESKAAKLAEDLEKARQENEQLKTENQNSVLSLQKITVKDKLAELLKDKPEKLREFILKKSGSWNEFSDESITAQITAAEEDYKFLAADKPDPTEIPAGGGGSSTGEDPAQKAATNPALNWDVK